MHRVGYRQVSCVMENDREGHDVLSVLGFVPSTLPAVAVYPPLYSVAVSGLLREEDCEQAGQRTESLSMLLVSMQTMHCYAWLYCLDWLEHTQPTFWKQSTMSTARWWCGCCTACRMHAMYCCLTAAAAGHGLPRLHPCQAHCSAHRGGPGWDLWQ
jgi:hypothetical protein